MLKWEHHLLMLSYYMILWCAYNYKFCILLIPHLSSISIWCSCAGFLQPSPMQQCPIIQNYILIKFLNDKSQPALFKNSMHTIQISNQSWHPVKWSYVLWYAGPLRPGVQNWQLSGGPDPFGGPKIFRATEVFGPLRLENFMGGHNYLEFQFLGP